ncbi:MAG: hypothetical protein ABI855_00560 [Bacteroidota bacterium]
MKKYTLPLILIIAGAAMLGFQNFTSGSMNDLDIKIENTPVIMPCAYKVYANPEALSGRFYLFKMLVTNNGSRPVRNLKASFSIPKYIESTELEKMSQLNPGQSVVIPCYPAFNDDVINKTTSSKEKVKIKIETSGGETEREFAFEMKGRNEFLYSCIPPDEIRTNADMEDNNPLLVCLVTPEDPIIKYYTQQIQEKVLKGEQASVSRKPEEAVRFLMGIYQATYLSHMVYSGTAGVPEKISDLSTLVQSLRLPREVVTGNTGLCIELTLLYASVMMSEGLDPVIFLIPGHAYPGFKLNGQYYAIESTAIGGEGIGGRSDAETALKAGMKNIDEFVKAYQSGDDRYSIVDVREMVAQQVKPMELKDDQFLRQKIDQIALTFTGGNAIPENVNMNQGGGNNSDAGNDGGNGMARYSGSVSFSYPSTWAKTRTPFPQLPQILYQMTSPDQIAVLQVYQIPGAQNGNSALTMIQQQLYVLGERVQFQAAGSKGSFEIFNGATYYDGGTLQWQAYIKRSGNGVAALIVGTNSGNGAYNGVFNQVIGTLQ